MLAALATLAVFASSAYAQSLNISSGCQTALTRVATSPEASCLNPSGLISAFATTSGNSSLVTPINNWLTGLCAQPACTNQTLSDVVTNVTTGCATDLASLGYQSSDTSTVIADVQRFYPAAREVVCLKNTTDNNLCITDFLTAIQSAVGPLSLNNLPAVVGKVINGGLAGSDVPHDLLCSNCAKEVVNVLNKDIPGLLSSNEMTQLSSTCGADFTNGQTPSTVTQTASGLSSNGNSSSGGSSKSGALANFPVSMIVFSLGGLASAFAVFA